MSSKAAASPSHGKLCTSAQALELVLKDARRLEAERVPLDLAAGRVLAEDVTAETDIPYASLSSMDGYALDAQRLEGDPPWVLPVAGEARAGHSPPRLAPGSACRVFTGAELPEGADSVVAQEDVLRRNEQLVLSTRPTPGQSVRAAGSDLPAGTKALLRGSRLTPGRIGLAAVLDRPYLEVARRPVVSVVATGDELRTPGAPARPASIVESSTFVVAAWARLLGAEVRLMPAVRDDPQETLRALERVLSGTDVLVTIGGVSVGEHDWVRPTLEKLGVALDFSGVAMSPGRPLTIGRSERARVLCLPGHSAAATLCFILFGAPLLRTMQGDLQPLPRRVPMRVLGSHVKRSPLPFEEFLRARLEIHDGELCAALLPSQSAGADTGFAEAQALVVLGADRKAIRHGDRLPVIALHDV